MRRRTGPVVLFASSLLLVTLTVAGCGSRGTVRPLPETVVGTVKQESPGKSIFLAQGCNACHTYTPAGSTGTVGPDLDKLPAYAKKANQPLDTFIHESIVDPNKYIEKGYPANVMPKTYGKLPAAQIHSLIVFLATPSG